MTTPIYYANSRPHIGTLYSTLLADVAARWQRFMGREVSFLTGTDEHGQKIAQAAELAGQAPQQFLDTIVPQFVDMWKLYNISYDRFIRTTEYAHKQTVTRWISEALKRGDIYKGVYEGKYCTPCETFVTDEGALACPSCGRAIDPVTEENYFFKLSAYQERLLAFYESHPDFIQPKERLNEITTFVAGGLRDLSISRRTVSWGIPFPGVPDQTIYVWADALLNYLSALGYLRSEGATEGMLEKFWPANLQVMAKDIVKFHAVYLPAFLMSAGIEPAQKLFVHGYILVNNDKMSKSKGNAVSPLALSESYGVDAVRYYLTRFMVPTHDGNFSLDDLETAINADLANNLGNLLHRTTMLAHKYEGAETAGRTTWSGASLALKSACGDMITAYTGYMEKHLFSQALGELMKFCSVVNGYFHEQQPWVQAKQNREAFAETIAATCQSLYVIAHLIAPVMPTKSQHILAALGHTVMISAGELAKNSWNVVCSLHIPFEPLFARIEQRVAVPGEQASEQNSQQREQSTSLPGASSDEANTGSRSENQLNASSQGADKPRKREDAAMSYLETRAAEEVKKALETSETVEKTYVTFEDFAKVQLIVGQILDCKPVEKSEKLYSLTVDLGEHGTRHIMAGIAQYYKPEELIEKKGVFVANLPPRKMLGLISEGMTLCAKDTTGNLAMVSVPAAIANGTRVS